MEIVSRLGEKECTAYPIGVIISALYIQWPCVGSTDGSRNSRTSPSVLSNDLGVSMGNHDRTVPGARISASANVQQTARSLNNLCL